MAAWQFKMCLVPRDWVNLNHGSTSALYTEEGCFDTTCAWENYSTSENISDLVGSYFQVAESWHKDQICFGSEKHSDVQVWYDKGKIDAIQVRIDMRENVVSLINKIIEIANKLSCCIFIPAQHNIIEPEPFEILRRAKSSNAFLYVSDHESWATEIKKI